MKAPFAELIVDLDGKAIPKEGEDDTVFTLEDVAVKALITPIQGEQVSPEERFKRGDLASRIYRNPDVDLKLEDITLIKTLIGKSWSPLVVFRAWTLLDPPAKAEA